jgi:hypothetical protein
MDWPEASSSLPQSLRDGGTYGAGSFRPKKGGESPTIAAARHRRLNGGNSGRPVGGTEGNKMNFVLTFLLEVVIAVLRRRR